MLTYPVTYREEKSAGVKRDGDSPYGCIIE
jgi:hypothetical protein